MGRLQNFQFLLVLAVLCALIPVLVYAVAFWGQGAADVKAWADYATFLSGTVAVVINGFGFLALLLTLHIQQDQIKKLEERAAKNETNETLSQLLAVHAQILTETDIQAEGSREVIATGRDAYRFFYKQFTIVLDRRRGESPGMAERDLVRQAFDEVYRRWGGDFGHYFRTLYHCFLIVEAQENTTTADKKKLVDLITCRLGKYELLMLMYNCLGTIGEKKFKPMAERLQLMEHVPRSKKTKRHLAFFAR